MMVPKTILITGANRGIGLELVRQLLGGSDKPKLLLAACRQPAQATELQTLKANNACLRLLSIDVTDDASIDRAVGEATTILGGEGLNLLLNNAGIYEEKAAGGELEKQTRELMQKHFNANATGSLIMSQKFLPLLKKAALSGGDQPMSCERAAILNMSSTMSSIGRLGEAINGYHYRISKTALNMCTALMANELRAAGILVAGLHPGWVQTDMGGANAAVTVQDSAKGLLDTAASLTEKSTGLLVDFKGDVIPF